MACCSPLLAASRQEGVIIPVSHHSRPAQPDVRLPLSLLKNVLGRGQSLCAHNKYFERFVVKSDATSYWGTM